MGGGGGIIWREFLQWDRGRTMAGECRLSRKDGRRENKSVGVNLVDIEQFLFIRYTCISILVSSVNIF